MAPHLTLQQREHARSLRREGRTIREVAAEIGCSRATVKNVVRARGKRESSQIVWSPGRSRLSLADREEISRGLSVGEPLRAVARRLGRAPSTISREVKANGGRSHYRAVPRRRRRHPGHRHPALIAAMRRVHRSVPQAALVPLSTASDEGGKPVIEWSDQSARDTLVSGLVNDAFAVLAAAESARLSQEGNDDVGLLALIAGQDVEPGAKESTWRIAR